MGPSPAADVFSFGLLTRFAVTGSEPQGHGLDSAMSSEAPFSEECNLLCKECCQQDSSKRPDMAGVRAMVLAWSSLDSNDRHSPKNSELNSSNSKVPLTYQYVVHLVRSTLAKAKHPQGTAKTSASPPHPE